MQAFYRGNPLAFQNDSVCHRLHAQHADLLLYEFRQNHLREATKMRVHHVQRHLHGVEVEAVILRDFQHIKMNVRIFVAGESDIANFASFLRLP